MGIGVIKKGGERLLFHKDTRIGGDRERKT